MNNLSYCVGGRHYSQTINETKIDRINPKSKR